MLDRLRKYSEVEILSEEFLTDRTSNKDRVANAVFNRRQQGAWVMVSEIRAKSRVLLVQLYV